jgi:hypothetical protein
MRKGNCSKYKLKKTFYSFSKFRNTFFKEVSTSHI